MKTKTYLTIAALAGLSALTVPAIADGEAPAADESAAPTSAAAAEGEAPADEPIDPSTLDKRLMSLFVERRECGCFGISSSGFELIDASEDPSKLFAPLEEAKLDMQAVYRSLAGMKAASDALMASEDMNTAKAHMSDLDAAFRQYEKASKAGRDAASGAYLRLVLRLLRENPTASAKTLLSQRVESLKKQCKIADYHIICEAMRNRPGWLNAGNLGYVVPELPEAAELMFREGAKNAANDKKAFASALEKKCLALWSIFSTVSRAAENMKGCETATAAKKHLGQIEKSIAEYETLRLRPCGRAAYGATEKLEIKAEVAAGYAQILESIDGQVSEAPVKKLIAPKLEAAKKKAETCEANVKKAKEKEASQRMGGWGSRS